MSSNNANLENSFKPEDAAAVREAGERSSDAEHLTAEQRIALETLKAERAATETRARELEVEREKLLQQNIQMKYEDERKTGDEIMAAYSETLPQNLRDSMPSLAEWYDKLSAALHTATEDVGLFDVAAEKIDKHFDIRRVHALDRASPEAKKSGART